MILVLDDLIDRHRQTLRALNDRLVALDLGPEEQTMADRLLVETAETLDDLQALREEVTRYDRSRDSR